MWIYLSLLSAVLLGCYDVVKKHAVRSNAVIPVLFVSSAAGFLVLCPLLLLSSLAPAVALRWGVPVTALPPQGHLLLAGKALLVGTSWLFAYFAMKHLPITLVSPVRASQPVWTMLGALLIFAERPGPLQWLGFLLITVSYFALMRTGRAEGIRFHANRWVFCIFAATALGALSALYDKWLLQQAGIPPLTVQVWFAFYLTWFVLVLLAAAWYPVRRAAPFAWRWSAPLTGILLVLSDFVYFHAVAQPEALISMVSPLRRSGAVLAFVAGGLLYQEQNKRRKALALAGVLAGVVLIACRH